MSVYNKSSILLSGVAGQILSECGKNGEQEDRQRKGQEMLCLESAGDGLNDITSCTIRKARKCKFYH